MQENETPIMVTELLKKAVAEKGQSGVARETGLTQPAIHRYLKGIGEPSTTTLKKLSDYFCVPIWALRGESPASTEQKASHLNLNIKPNNKGALKNKSENTTKENSARKTPPMVTELLKKAVAEKSQSAVAREAGLTLLTVQQYLKGIGEPRQKNLERLAKYFGVSVWELRGDFDLNEFCKSVEPQTPITIKGVVENFDVVRVINNLLAKELYDEKLRNPDRTKEEYLFFMRMFIDVFQRLLAETNEDLREYYKETLEQARSAESIETT